MRDEPPVGLSCSRVTAALRGARRPFHETPLPFFNSFPLALSRRACCSLLRLSPFPLFIAIPILLPVPPPTVSLHIISFLFLPFFSVDPTLPCLYDATLLHHFLLITRAGFIWFPPPASSLSLPGPPFLASLPVAWMLDAFFSVVAVFHSPFHIRAGFRSPVIEVLRRRSCVCADSGHLDFTITISRSPRTFFDFFFGIGPPTSLSLFPSREACAPFLAVTWRPRSSRRLRATTGLRGGTSQVFSIVDLLTRRLVSLFFVTR